MSTEYEAITLGQREGVMTITMNRPDRLNAWTYQMGEELARAVTAANDDQGVIAIVLTGAGRGFCAGADMRDTLDAPAEGDGGPGDDAGTRISYNWVDLVRSSKPMIAAVNGAAIGVGLSQILPMDSIVAARGAKLSMRFIKLGVVPELGSSHFLPMRVGFGAASELMLTGKTVLAEEAFEMGLVDKLAEPDDLLELAHATAVSMGENPQAALRMVKALITQNLAEPSLDEVQRRELRALHQAFETPEHKEAVRAFIEKREPNFRGARQA